MAPRGRAIKHYSHKTTERQNKATSSLFLIKMIAKLERDTQPCITKQGPNTNPKPKQRTNHNRTTALEQTAVKATGELNP